MILERVAALRWVKSLSFHNTSGQQVGALSLEGGLIRFGIQVEGQPYSDDAFVREAAPYTGLLTKLLQRAPITQEEVKRLHGMPLLLRRTLRSVTARALRRLALLSDLSQLRSSEKDLDGVSPPSSLHFSYPAVELMLAAGGSGIVRYSDLAARLYETPPDLAKERWLFEFQVGDPLSPWPIMTTRMAERKANTVTQFGLLGQSLARQIVATRHGSTRRPLAAEVVVTADHAYYVISTDRYLTLLVYESVHAERLLRSMEISVLGSGELYQLTSPAAPRAEASPVPPVLMVQPVPPIPLLPPAPSVVPVPPPAAELKPQPPPIPEKEKEPVALPEEPEHAPYVLEIRSLSARIEERTILSEIGLRLSERGVCALMGPGGSGKSSLLGILSGRNRTASGWTLSGEILYAGTPLGTAERPAVIGQKVVCEASSLRGFLLSHLGEGEAQSISQELLAELLWRVRLERLIERLDEHTGGPPLSLTRTEWRLLVIARELLSDPPLLCVDEPTAGLEDAEAQPLLSVLASEGTRRAVLFVTHNQEHARSCCDRVILLAGGRIQEHRSATAFFNTPRSQAARDYVRTGGCSVPSGTPDHETRGDEPRALHGAVMDPVPSPAPIASPPSLPSGPARTVWECPSPVLSLRGFGLDLGERVLLSSIDLDVAERGVHLLVAHNEAETRLFRAALCGPRPRSMRLLGQATYLRRPLLDGASPITPQVDARQALSSVTDYLTSDLPERGTLSRAVLAEHARQLLLPSGRPELIARLDAALCDLDRFERSCVELLRAVAMAPALLLLDGPLVGLHPGEQAALLQLLQEQASQRALLVFVRSAAPFMDQGVQPPPKVAWLREGRVLDTPPILSAPDRAGPLPPAASAQPAPSDPRSLSTPAVPRTTRGSGPRGFKWLRPGALAGMPAPGVMDPLDYDLELIRDAGISHLITLTEEPLPAESVRRQGLESVFFPIPDMGAPEIEATADLCRRVAELLNQGHAVGYHCKAGLGRTGTLLAAQLLFEGADARAALARVRAIEPGWVQSDRQEQFLRELHSWLHRT